MAENFPTSQDLKSSPNPTPSDEQDFYPMTLPTGHGIVVILHNYSHELKGYVKDVENIVKFFSDIMFYPEERIIILRDLKKETFLDKIKQIQTRLQGMANVDRLFVFILSHGSSKGVLMCDNEYISVNEITKEFEHDKLQILKDKPKMFFVQTCRGEGTLQGAALADKSQIVQQGSPVALGSDILIGQSVLLDHTSWVSNGEGSLFIQALIDEFNKNLQDKDVLEMLTNVNMQISRKQIKPNVFQMPEFSSRLTRKVWLYREA